MPQLTVNESAGDFTHVVKLNYLQLQAIGTGNSKTILTLPAGSAVDLVGIVNSVDIVGSSTLSVEVGYVGTTAAFIAAWDVDAATVCMPVFNTGSDLAAASATATTIKGGSLPVKAVSADTAVVIKVTDSSLASITAGEIIIGFRVINLCRFR
jgi:hypothetical protein